MRGSQDPGPGFEAPGVAYPCYAPHNAFRSKIHTLVPEVSASRYFFKLAANETLLMDHGDGV